MYDYGILAASAATPQAREAAVRAVALNDRLAEAHNSLGHLALHDWEWADAEREFTRALELNPSYASGYHWYALYLTTVGRLDEAIRAIEKAHQLDPTSLRIRVDVGQAYNVARRPNEAIEHEERVLEINPNHRGAHWISGMAHEQKGEFDLAIRKFQEALKRDPNVPNYASSRPSARMIFRPTVRMVIESRAPTYDDSRGFQW
jgi:tetratricopeptide (TPR) repeat protein